ncbi:MAG: hypothetical protein ACJAZN_000889, partial [Planctomycetota bacterium]
MPAAVADVVAMPRAFRSRKVGDVQSPPRIRRMPNTRLG